VVGAFHQETELKLVFFYVKGLLLELVADLLSTLFLKFSLFFFFEHFLFHFFFSLPLYGLFPSLLCLLLLLLLLLLLSDLVLQL